MRSSSSQKKPTPDAIVDAALRLFRKKGFEKTTMRDVAEATGMSLGAAYYHYETKEALVAAYYQRLQDQHQQLVQAALPRAKSLEDRLDVVFRTKLDLISDDRNFLGALFRFVGDPGHPLSVLGEQTQALRHQSVATFAAALEGMNLNPGLTEAAATALWAAHLGLVLYAIHDPTPKLRRTKGLLQATVRPAAQALQLLRVPGMTRILKPVLNAIREAGLLT